MPSAHARPVAVSRLLLDSLLPWFLLASIIRAPPASPTIRDLLYREQAHPRVTSTTVAKIQNHQRLLRVVSQFRQGPVRLTSPEPCRHMVAACKSEVHGQKELSKSRLNNLSGGSVFF
ncbi:hypothetical protein NL676_028920 [Syzygium grande]|nr:hypothetical protein NL676_028920 [Syzygium grande]